MTPLQALASATRVTASLFGLVDVGLVEPGHAADLLILEGDPTVGVEALRDPAVVLRAGRPVGDLPAPILAPLDPVPA
jgi:imidazolonepropionase-like amidohydrolase